MGLNMMVVRSKHCSSDCCTKQHCVAGERVSLPYILQVPKEPLVQFLSVRNSMAGNKLVHCAQGKRKLHCRKQHWIPALCKKQIRKKTSYKPVMKRRHKKMAACHLCHRLERHKKGSTRHCRKGYGLSTVRKRYPVTGRREPCHMMHRVHRVLSIPPL